MISLTKKTLQDLNIPENKWMHILTVASIVEREVAQERYYGKVARVIENRISGSNETAGKLQWTQLFCMA